MYCDFGKKSGNVDLFDFDSRVIFTSSRTKSRAWNSYSTWKFMVIQLIFMNMNFDEKCMNFLNMNFTSHELAVNMNNTFMKNLIIYISENHEYSMNMNFKAMNEFKYEPNFYEFLT